MQICVVVSGRKEARGRTTGDAKPRHRPLPTIKRASSFAERYKDETIVCTFAYNWPSLIPEKSLRLNLVTWSGVSVDSFLSLLTVHQVFFPSSSVWIRRVFEIFNTVNVIRCRYFLRPCPYHVSSNLCLSRCIFILIT